MSKTDFQNGFALGMASGGVSDYTLPIGGDELGGVKNGGNVTINEDGTMTAPIGGGSTNEEWIELLKTTLTDDVAYVDLVAPDGKRFSKIHILIDTGSAGLSTASNILVKGVQGNWFDGGNQEYLTKTQGTVSTWAYPIFMIEKGELFPIAYSSNGAINGLSSVPIYMGGVGQNNNIFNTRNNGLWKTIRIQPQTANVVFKAGVSIYAWGVYEDE